MNFAESNTVEQLILNAVTKLGGKQVSMIREDALPYVSESPSDKLCPARWASRAKVAVSKETCDTLRALKGNCYATNHPRNYKETSL
jgi:hypothetical protein